MKSNLGSLKDRWHLSHKLKFHFKWSMEQLARNWRKWWRKSGMSLEVLQLPNRKQRFTFVWRVRGKGEHFRVWDPVKCFKYWMNFSFGFTSHRVSYLFCSLCFWDKRVSNPNRITCFLDLQVNCFFLFPCHTTCVDRFTFQWSRTSSSACVLQNETNADTFSFFFFAIKFVSDNSAIYNNEVFNCH